MKSRRLLIACLALTSSLALLITQAARNRQATCIRFHPAPRIGSRTSARVPELLVTRGALAIAETAQLPAPVRPGRTGSIPISDSAPFTSGCCGGVDLTGLSSISLDFGHNGANPVNVQFFTQADTSSTYVVLNPGGTDIAAGPATTTYNLPLSGMTANQIAFIRTIGVSIRDHLTEGNLTFTLDNIKSTGTPLFSRTIADHDGGAADFDGVICNFDCAAIGGGNGGQNNSGMSVVGGAAQWTDLGGGPGAAVTWGNGTQNSGGSFNAKPVDLSNYDTATIRMSATGQTHRFSSNFICKLVAHLLTKGSTSEICRLTDNFTMS